MLNTSKIFISDLLDFLRNFASNENMDFKRLPAWMTAAKIHVGLINNESMICVFRDAPKRDSFKLRGIVGADTVVLLDTENFIPKGASLEARDSDNLVIMVGEHGKQGGSVMHLASPQSAFFNCGYAGHHGPIGIESLFFEQRTENNGLLVGFVPFALYLHKNDISGSKAFLKKNSDHLLSLLRDIHNSSKGDYYKNRQSPVEAFTINKESGVIVLGKDSGAELTELTQVKDRLHSRGYYARLIKEMPEIPMMSNEEKVRLWALASRFVVMIDNVPTGHIAEYMMLKEQRTILALLRKKGSGSTYMIGDDHLTDVNYIKLFEYDTSPLTVIQEVIAWAEKLVGDRIKAYNEKYPWR